MRFRSRPRAGRHRFDADARTGIGSALFPTGTAADHSARHLPAAARKDGRARAAASIQVSKNPQLVTALEQSGSPIRRRESPACSGPISLIIGGGISKEADQFNPRACPRA